MEGGLVFVEKRRYLGYVHTENGAYPNGAEGSKSKRGKAAGVHTVRSGAFCVKSAAKIAQSLLSMKSG